MYCFALSQVASRVAEEEEPRTPAIVPAMTRAATASAATRGLSSGLAKRKASPTATGTGGRRQGGRRSYGAALPGRSISRQASWSGDDSRRAGLELAWRPHFVERAGRAADARECSARPRQRTSKIPTRAPRPDLRPVEARAPGCAVVGAPRPSPALEADARRRGSHRGSRRRGSSEAERGRRPAAYAFVSALAVLPTASSTTVRPRTSGRSRATVISTMPAALSRMGPNASMARTIGRRAEHPHRGGRRCRTGRRARGRCGRRCR